MGKRWGGPKGHTVSAMLQIVGMRKAYDPWGTAVVGGPVLSFVDSEESIRVTPIFISVSDSEN